MLTTTLTTVSKGPAVPPPGLAVELAGRELDSLVAQLEISLTPQQASLLYQIRLTAESLGAARASLLARFR